MLKLNSNSKLHLRYKTTLRVCSVLLLASVGNAVAWSSTSLEGTAQVRMFQVSRPVSHTASFRGGTCGQQAYRKIRGRIVTLTPAKSAKGQSVITIAHEAIPNFMEAMIMTMPLRHAVDAKRFKNGDKIRFDLVLHGGTFYVENVQKLPPGTKLKLADS